MKKISMFLLILVIIFTGCAKKSYNRTEQSISDMDYGDSKGMEYNYDTYDTEDGFSLPQEEKMEYEGDEEGESIYNSTAIDSGLSNLSVNNKIIKRYELYLETKEFDKFINNINNQVSSLGGYIESSKIDGRRYYYSDNLKHASIIVRIPKTKSDLFLNNINENSNVVERAEYSEDVTLQYVDAEGRKKSLEVQYDRVLEILSKTEKLSDILLLEERLNNLRYEIERYGSTLKLYDNLVEYTTINLQIEEVKEITPLIEEDESALDRISNGFMKNLKKIIHNISEIIINLIIAIPYLVIFLGIILLIFLIIKRTIGHNRNVKRFKDIDIKDEDFNEKSKD